MFCSKCGAKNMKNAKFCKECGETLNSDVKKEVVSQTKFDFKDFFDKLLKNIKNIFVSPVSSARDFIKEENFITGLIYLCINVLVMGLFALGIAKVAYSALFVFSGMSSFGGYSYDFSVPYLKIFFMAIIFSAIYYAVILGIALVMDKYLFKGNVNYKKLTTWLGYNSIVNTLLVIVALLLVLLDGYNIALWIYILVVVYYTYNLCVTYKETSDVNENKIGYILTSAMFCAVLVVAVILPKIFS